MGIDKGKCNLKGQQTTLNRKYGRQEPDKNIELKIKEKCYRNKNENLLKNGE